MQCPLDSSSWWGNGRDFFYFPRLNTVLCDYPGLVWESDGDGVGNLLSRSAEKIGGVWLIPDP